MIPRTFRFFPWLLLTLTLLAGGCGGGGGAGGGGTAQNLAPFLDPIDNQVITLGETLSFTLRASDPNGKDTVRIFTDTQDDPRLSPTAGNPASAIFRWTPTGADLQNDNDTPVSITFTASDGLLNVSRTIIITIKAPVSPPANTPPALAPIGNKSINDTGTLSFTVSALDPDGDPVTLTATGLPTGATFSGGEFSWTPGPAALGNHTVTFSASDGALTVQEQIVISVVNSAPVITITQAPPASVTENEPLTITFSVADPDLEDVITVTASGSAIDFGGVLSYDPITQTGSFSWTPALVTAGSFSVTFAADDGTSAVAEISVIVYVRTNPLLATDIIDPSLRGITIFPQTTPALDGVPELFPGQANFWDIDPDIAQLDGFWNQFDGNLVLDLPTGGLPGDGLFPSDQSYNQLTFMTPLLSALDGLRVAVVAEHAEYSGPDPDNPVVADPDEGNASAWLNATADSRLQQIIDLRQAGASLTLSWKDEFLVQSPAFFGDASAAGHYYRVVATVGTVRTVLFDGPMSARNVVETTPSRQRVSRTADLSALAGKQILLSFELRGAHHSLLVDQDNLEFFGSYARIDNVSLRDGATEYIVNGDFESGMTGWTANAGLQSQNLRSAPRPLGGLTVTRHVYTVPNQLWARWTDEFVNTTGAEITRRVFLRTFLGSGGFGIIYPDLSNQALTSWDGTAPDPDNDIIPDRDIGLVFGTIADPTDPNNLDYLSDDVLNAGNGSAVIEVAHDVTIPAGGRVTLVHFALMSGENTGAGAVDTSARAATIDTEIANILNNFCSNPRYRDGMTAAQLATLQNFPLCP